MKSRMKSPPSALRTDNTPASRDGTSATRPAQGKAVVGWRPAQSNYNFMNCHTLHSWGLLCYHTQPTFTISFCRLMAPISFMEILKWNTAICVIINTFIVIFCLSLLVYLLIPSSCTPMLVLSCIWNKITWKFVKLLPYPLSNPFQGPISLDTSVWYLSIS